MRNLTAIPGVKVGHYTDREGVTGCTVILLPEKTVGGVDVRGAAPGTREVELLRPAYRAREVHAFLLTGGSAFGLDAAGGVMAFLEERGRGVEVGVTRVPLVPTAVIFDLNIGSPKARPTREAGYEACLRATSGELPEGSVGAGTGATVAKLFGIAGATKGGLGSWAVTLDSGIVVGALAVVNAWGDIFDPETNTLLAAPRDPVTRRMRPTLELWPAFPRRGWPPENTTLGVVGTNARLTKEEVNKVAQMAHDGLARVIRPVHTSFDGDTIFAFATGEAGEIEVSLVGALAAEVLAKAVVRAVRAAESLGGVPCVRELG